jgi:hypothetical protein
LAGTLAPRFTHDDTVADAAWTPLAITPAHPSYSSGPSTVSAAAATVLGNFFGDDSIAFTDTAELSAGGATIARSFEGFWEAAEEAAASRLYGGIHWSFDNEVGLETGRDVGRFVSDRLLRPLGRSHRDGHDDRPGSPSCDGESGGRGRASIFDDRDEDVDADRRWSPFASDCQ